MSDGTATAILLIRNVPTSKGIVKYKEKQLQHLCVTSDNKNIWARSAVLYGPDLVALAGLNSTKRPKGWIHWIKVPELELKLSIVSINSYSSYLTYQLIADVLLSDW